MEGIRSDYPEIGSGVETCLQEVFWGFLGNTVEGLKEADHTEEVECEVLSAETPAAPMGPLALGCSQLR